MEKSKQNECACAYLYIQPWISKFLPAPTLFSQHQWGILQWSVCSSFVHARDPYWRCVTEVQTPQQKTRTATKKKKKPINIWGVREHSVFLSSYILYFIPAGSWVYNAEVCQSNEGIACGILCTYEHTNCSCIVHIQQIECIFKYSYRSAVNEHEMYKIILRAYGEISQVYKPLDFGVKCCAVSVSCRWYAMVLHYMASFISIFCIVSGATPTSYNYKCVGRQGESVEQNEKLWNSRWKLMSSAYIMGSSNDHVCFKQQIILSRLNAPVDYRLWFLWNGCGNGSKVNTS